MSSPPEDPSVAQERILVAALASGVLAGIAITPLLPLVEPARLLAAPVALAGAVSPVIGFRLYERRRRRLPPGAALAQRRAAYRAALLAALGPTEAIGLAGVLIAGMTREYVALVGAAMHVVLAGALWPTSERLESFSGEEAEA